MVLQYHQDLQLKHVGNISVSLFMYYENEHHFQLTCCIATPSSTSPRVTTVVWSILWVNFPVFWTVRFPATFPFFSNLYKKRATKLKYEKYKFAIVYVIVFQYIEVPEVADHHPFPSCFSNLVETVVN